jgi:hypothetical protein
MIVENNGRIIGSLSTIDRSAYTAYENFMVLGEEERINSERNAPGAFPLGAKCCSICKDEGKIFCVDDKMNYVFSNTVNPKTFSDLRMPFDAIFVSKMISVPDTDNILCGFLIFNTRTKTTEDIKRRWGEILTTPETLEYVKELMTDGVLFSAYVLNTILLKERGGEIDLLE